MHVFLLKNCKQLQKIIIDDLTYKINYGLFDTISSCTTTYKNKTFKNTYLYLASINNSECKLSSLINNQTFSIDGNNQESIDYAYYNNNNIKNITYLGKSISYQYDNFNRLRNENNEFLNEFISYSYDAQGNLLKVIDVRKNVAKHKFTYNNYNQLIKKENQDGSYEEYAYNENGALSFISKHECCASKTCLQEKNISLSYDEGNILRRYDNVVFKYNEEGIRISKKASVFLHKYYVEGSTIHKEEIINLINNKVEESIYYYYDAQGITGFKYQGKFYIYLKDLTGNIIGIYNEYGKEVARYIYDAYGNHEVLNEYGIINNNATFIGNINPFRYKGYYYDVETGFYYCNSRYYNSKIYRWISADDIDYLEPESINGLNLYVYCGNDPINYTDPTGHAIISILVGLGITALIGATIGAASYTVGQLINYAITGNFEWSWGGFLGSTIGGAIGGAITFATAGTGITVVTMLGTFLSGVAITSSTMIGENIAGDTSHSLKDIFISSIISGCISLASVGIMSKIRIQKLNAGRGSMSAISKQIYTKFRRQIIKRVSIKTFEKMLAIEAYNSTAGNIIEWAFSISGAKDYVLNTF